MTERTPASALTADEIITHLKHGPGGYFRETFRDEPGHKGRAHSTAILYLLRTGEVSRWHQARRDAPRAPPRSRVGEHPHVLVPAGAWQSARSLGPWTLSGCTVAPGFDFSGFELAPDDWMR
jgi:uncharacterized protein